MSWFVCFMSSCQTALAQGRYRWRHDIVLRELADTLEWERGKKRNAKKKACPAINFVKEGQTGKKTKAPTTSILDESDCLEMKVELGKQLVYPNIIHTAQRPDIVIWSPNDRKLVMVELTVPLETICEEAYERKMAKYTEIQEQCRSCGWSTWLFPVEIGCRGFPAQSLWRMLGTVGIAAGDRKRAVWRLGQAAEKESNWLWMKREKSWSLTTGP